MDISALFGEEVSPWPHQQFGVAEAIKAIEANEPSCVTSPTGSGKSMMMIAIIRWCVQNHKRVILYTNRKMLTDQTMRVLDKSGVDYGVIAASHDDRRAFLRDVQIASIQTIHSRVVRKKSQDLWPANVVLADECHVLGNGTNEQVLRQHQEQGAVLIGVTATPMGISHLYPHLIVAGRNSECRACGALVPATIYAPSEMDTSRLKLQDNGEFNYEEVKKECFGPKARHAIFGHVFKHWREVNPEARPAIGFAPGVAESKWFVDQFAERGVRCAHIDGADCYIDGEEIESSQEVRDEIIAEAKAGKVAVIWNRFVLREGIDLPFIYHGILATPFGSMMSYIQSCGRILRYSDVTPDRVIITDHAGNWWRHQSPNADFDWAKWYFGSPSLPTKLKMDAIRERTEPTPIVCEKCGVIRYRGAYCPFCKHHQDKKKRMVIQKDGSLKPMYGEPLPRKIVREKPDTYSKWKSMYHRGKKADMSFAQCVGLFVVENGYWPPTDMPLMPKHKTNMYSKVRHVPNQMLISTHEHVDARTAEGRSPVMGVVKTHEQGRIF